MCGCEVWTGSNGSGLEDGFRDKAEGIIKVSDTLAHEDENIISTQGNCLRSDGNFLYWDRIESIKPVWEKIGNIGLTKKMVGTRKK